MLLVLLVLIARDFFLPPPPPSLLLLLYVRSYELWGNLILTNGCISHMSRESLALVKGCQENKNCLENGLAHLHGYLK